MIRKGKRQKRIKISAGSSAKVTPQLHSTSRHGKSELELASHTEASIPGEIVSSRKPGCHDQQTHPIERALESFLSAIDDYSEAALLAIPLVAEKRAQQLKAIELKFEKLPALEDEADIDEHISAEPHRASDVLKTIRASERLLNSRILQAVERSFFIGLFSEYDVFLGSLLRAIYSRKPELFRGIRREIALTDLIEFGNLEAVMLDMLEKEIESFRRESYVEQFCKLEQKFDIKSLRAFPEWPTFVEIGQRRNLMAHNDGCVSQQYLFICEREKYVFDPRPNVGEKLDIDAKYLAGSIFILCKVAFMLCHTLWRKVLPDECPAADDAFNATVYELLVTKRWRHAAEFGLFGLQEQMVRQATDMNRLIRVINTAIALKQLNRQSEVDQLLGSEDWSASLREFALANAVLKDQFGVAGKIMRDIGRRGELINQFNYHEWPLFETFRDRVEFQEAYADIYGEPFLRKVSEEAQQRYAKIKQER